jgi:hypothetical protein
MGHSVISACEFEVVSQSYRAQASVSHSSRCNALPIAWGQGMGDEKAILLLQISSSLGGFCKHCASSLVQHPDKLLGSNVIRLIVRCVLHSRSPHGLLASIEDIITVLLC